MMKIRYLVPAMLAALLSACGGDSETQATVPAASQPVRTLATTAPVEQAGHAETVAQLYLAYLMRPADPVGQEHFSQALQTLGLPNDIHQLNEAYHSNAGLHALVNTFSTSSEAAEVHGWGQDTTDDMFISTIYQNLLGRPADLEGLKFWVATLRERQLTRDRVALMIISAAQKNQSPQGLLDGALIRNRILFSTRATSELRRLGLDAYYVGSNKAAIGRSYVLRIIAEDTPATIEAKLADFIKEIKGEPIFCDPGPCVKAG